MADRRASFGRRIVVLVAVAISGCFVFPAPVPPTPLTKPEVGALAKCQKAIKKSQIAFIKTKLGALESCIDGILTVRLPFENGLTTQEDFDAGIVKMRGKCDKSYAKVTAASTKMVDGILKACTPVEAFVVGPYDGLRVMAALDSFGDPPASLLVYAASLCTLTEELADSQLWHAAPRMLELLGYLGPQYWSSSTSTAGSRTYRSTRAVCPSPRRRSPDRRSGSPADQAQEPPADVTREHAERQPARLQEAVLRDHLPGAQLEQVDSFDCDRRRGV